MVSQLFFNFRKTNNDIIVKDLSKDGNKRIPNPVRTFEEAFQHYRNFLSILCHFSDSDDLF